MENLPDSLIHWYINSYRKLPWRENKDPYRIWLSEVILQQTRVEQGLPYFNKFIERYPTLENLANANEQEVLKLWQGLGYYSRARNMLITAQIVMEEHNGEFPTSYDSLLKLKGIGPYTASAIASFAFDLPHPVKDGNVERVISRMFAIQADVKTRAGQMEIDSHLNSIFPTDRAAIFNQAIMELGSQVCTPKSPKCELCPWVNNCIAFELKQQEQFPKKKKKKAAVHVHFNYLIIENNQKIYIEQRQDGIWKNLYQFPLIQGQIPVKELVPFIENKFGDQKIEELELSYKCIHVLSHLKINAHFYKIQFQRPFKPQKSAIFEIDIEELNSQYPVPVLIDKFLKIRRDNG
ncbi:MAG: A/G-specific adenine glycosylase [Bacteroidia bacterium]